MKKRLTLFAHWDQDNTIDDYVIYYLSELKKVSDIIFVSDCDLAEDEIVKINPLTLISKAERHGEYDFGSYKRAYLLATDIINDYQELLLVNDSCYGPIFPLATFLDNTNDSDFWGIYKHKTPEFENIEHIQSFFMVFKEEVFKSNQFKLFLMNVKKEKMKKDIIGKYEIGLSKILHENEFKSSSVIPCSTKAFAYEEESLNFNLQEKVPLIKREILLNNSLCALNIYNYFLKLPFDNSLKRKILLNLNRLSDGRYANKWFFSPPSFLTRTRNKYILFNRKFILAKYVPFKYGFICKIKIFGLSCIKIPIFCFENHVKIYRNFTI